MNFLTDIVNEITKKFRTAKLREIFILKLIRSIVPDGYIVGAIGDVDDLDRMEQNISNDLDILMDTTLGHMIDSKDAIIKEQADALEEILEVNAGLCEKLHQSGLKNAKYDRLRKKLLEIVADNEPNDGERLLALLPREEVIDYKLKNNIPLFQNEYDFVLSKIR